MEEGTVVEWKVEEGDEVKADQVIVVVESEKTANDVESREDGVLRQIIVSEGTTIEPGDPIGIVAERDEDLSSYLEDVDAAAVESGSEDDDSTEESDDSGKSADDAPAPSSSVPATPGARKLAREVGVDLTDLEGSGPGGAIIERDVEQADEAQDGGGGAEVTILESKELTKTQQVISERLSNSYRERVHVTLNRTIQTDIINDVLPEDLSINDVLVKASAKTLAANPAFNAHFDGETHDIIEEVNVAIAVDNNGKLITPVIPNADQKTIEELSSERQRVTQMVLDDEHTMDDLEGGTFTISNLGMFGVDSFNPVINPPQIAILGVGRERSNNELTLSLSFDHRVVNGASAAKFLDDLAGNLTDGDSLRSLVRGD